MPLAFGAIVFRRRLQLVCRPGFQVGEVAGGGAGSRTNRWSQSFATLGEIRDYAVFAGCCCSGSSVVIPVARCVVGKISELYRKIVVAAGEATAFSWSQLIG